MRSFIDRTATMAAASAFLGACLLVLPLGASAQQSTPPMSPSPAPAATMSAPAAPAAKSTRSSKVEARIKSLHAQLKITPDEEQDWSVVAQTMRDNAQKMDELVQERQEKLGTLNAVDDMKSYQAIAQAHADGMQKLVPAFEALYEKMPAAQQKRADVVINERTTARRGPASRKG